MDRIILLSLFSKVWLIVTGILTIYLIGTELTIVEQGFFYVLNSLIAIQIFFELGLNSAIVQYISHEMPKLKWSKFVLVGKLESRQIVSSIVRLVFKWYSYVALILIFIVAPLGYFTFFDSEAAMLVNADVAWLLLVVFVGFNLVISSVISLIEGTLHVFEAVLMRFLQAFFSSVVLVVSLYSSDLGVLALPLGSLIAVLFTAFFIIARYRRFFIDMFSLERTKFDMSGLLSFQWKIAVSWIAGFFVYHFPIPLMMYLKNPELSALIGMSYQIMLSITGTAIVWMTTSAARFGSLVSSKDYENLNALFKRQFIRSFLFLLVTLIVFNLFFNSDFFQSTQFKYRVVSSEVFLVLSLITLATHVHLSQQIYLRAFKEEPFWKLSIVMAVTVLILFLLLVPQYEIWGAVAAYFIGMVGVGLIYGTVVFYLFRKNRIKNGNIGKELCLSYSQK